MTYLFSCSQWKDKNNVSLNGEPLWAIYKYNPTINIEKLTKVIIISTGN